MGQPLRSRTVLRRRAGQQSTDRCDDVGIGRAGIAQRQPEQDSGHMAVGVPLYGGVRRLRRIQRVPAHVPHDRFRAGTVRCGVADGGLRGPRSCHAADRRLAVRPTTPRAGPGCGLHGDRRPRGACVAGTGSDTRRDDCLPRHGRRSRRRYRRRLRTGRPTGPAGTGRIRDRRGRCRRWLGGFFPPLVMGLVYGSLDDYTVGYLLLAVTAAIAALFTATVVRRRATR
jgi:hypothetical protein